MTNLRLFRRNEILKKETQDQFPVGTYFGSHEEFFLKLSKAHKFSFRSMRVVPIILDRKTIRRTSIQITEVIQDLQSIDSEEPSLYRIDSDPRYVLHIPNHGDWLLYSQQAFSIAAPLKRKYWVVLSASLTYR